MMKSMTKKTRLIDTYIGEKIKEARLEAGISSCEALGKILKLSGTMVYKYETAQHRLTVARLGDICKALKKDVMFFLPKDFGK